MTDIDNLMDLDKPHHLSRLERVQSNIDQESYQLSDQVVLLSYH